MKLKSLVITAFFSVPLYLLLAHWFEPESSFVSSNGLWADGEQLLKGRDYDMIRTQFLKYKYGCEKDVELFRVTRKQWFNVFAWPSYLFDSKWDLKYKDRGELDDNYKAYMRPPDHPVIRSK